MQINDLFQPLIQTKTPVATVSEFIRDLRTRRHTDLETSPVASQRAKRERAKRGGPTKEQLAILAELGISGRMVRELLKTQVKEV